MVLLIIGCLVACYVLQYLIVYIIAIFMEKVHSIMERRKKLKIHKEANLIVNEVLARQLDVEEVYSYFDYKIKMVEGRQRLIPLRKENYKEYFKLNEECDFYSEIRALLWTIAKERCCTKERDFWEQQGIIHKYDQIIKTKYL